MENKTKEYNSDITERDKEKLGELARAIRNDRQGDDAQLKNRERPIDFTGKDLDVPSMLLSSYNIFLSITVLTQAQQL